MSVIFFIPLSLIALYESQVEHSRRFLELFPEENLEAEGDPSVEDPEAENDEGNQISKVKFAELVGSFPDATLGDQATIVNEIVRHSSASLLYRSIPKLTCRLYQNSTNFLIGSTSFRRRSRETRASREEVKSRRQEPFPSLSYPPPPFPSIISLGDPLSIFLFLSCIIVKTF